jgi:hypothetical protein
MIEVNPVSIPIAANSTDRARPGRGAQVNQTGVVLYESGKP